MNMKMNMKMKIQKKTGRTPAPCSELAVVLVFLVFLFSGAVLYLLLPKQVSAVPVRQKPRLFNTTEMEYPQ